jgi:hypothetical protein
MAIGPGVAALLSKVLVVKLTFADCVDTDVPTENVLVKGA